MNVWDYAKSKSIAKSCFKVLAREPEEIVESALLQEIEHEIISTKNE